MKGTTCYIMFNFYSEKFPGTILHILMYTRDISSFPANIYKRFIDNKTF